MQEQTPFSFPNFSGAGTQPWGAQGVANCLGLPSPAAELRDPDAPRLPCGTSQPGLGSPALGPGLGHGQVTVVRMQTWLVGLHS